MFEKTMNTSCTKKPCEQCGKMTVVCQQDLICSDDGKCELQPIKVICDECINGKKSCKSCGCGKK